MDITLLIGNGFDLNLNLRTKYTDFYPYFEKHAAEGNLISKEISGNYALWSDLELELGKQLGNCSNGSLDNFNRYRTDLENNLCEYLREEQARFQCEGHSSEVNEELFRSLKNFTSGLTRADKELIKSVRDIYKGEHCKYNFLSFNYTDCLDRIIKHTDKTRPVDSHRFNGVTIFDAIGNLLHVHGIIDDGLILGVNDTDQICDEMFKVDPGFCDSFIKQRMNAVLGERKLEDAAALLSNSKIVGIYGMSMGDTDIYWWEKLYEWLCASSHCLLIIYSYDGDDYALKRKSPQRISFLNNQIRNKFLEKAGRIATKEKTESVKSRILVSHYNDLFQFSKFTVGSAKGQL